NGVAVGCSGCGVETATVGAAGGVLVGGTGAGVMGTGVDVAAARARTRGVAVWMRTGSSRSTGLPASGVACKAVSSFLVAVIMSCERAARRAADVSAE